MELRKKKRIKELHCSILDFVLGSSAALCHKVGNFWDQGERTFSLTKKEHRCCASMLATACAAAREEGKGLWPFLSLPAVRCQCAGWMETLLLCWCRNLPSPFLVHSCRGWDITQTTAVLKQNWYPHNRLSLFHTKLCSPHVSLKATYLEHLVLLQRPSVVSPVKAPTRH